VLQAACQLAYVDDDHSSDNAQRLPQQSDDFQSVEQETNEQATLETDNIRSLPVSVVIDDSESHTDAEQCRTVDIVTTDR